MTSAPDAGSVDALWAAYCDALKSAGRALRDPPVPLNALDRAEGVRYLTRLARLGLEMMVEHADAEFPSLYQASHTTLKIGADNPEAIYWNAPLRGDRRYRLTGRRGTVPFLSFATRANRYHIDGTMASTGELAGAELVTDADGRFAIDIGPERGGVNWLPTAPDSSMLLIRQTFLDRAREEPLAALSLVCCDAPAEPAPLQVDSLAAALQRAAAFVEGTSATFSGWTRDFARQPNELATIDQARFVRAGGDPRIQYLHGYWDLRDAVALVIDLMPPACELWNFQVNNVWMESLDYRWLPVCVNSSSARVNADGGVTLVIAPRDLHFGSWLTTGGHAHGTMLLRTVGAEGVPRVATRLIRSWEALRAHGTVAP